MSVATQQTHYLESGPSENAGQMGGHHTSRGYFLHQPTGHEIEERRNTNFVVVHYQPPQNFVPFEAVYPADQCGHPHQPSSVYYGTFSDKIVRHRFMSKVCSLLSIQLTFLFATILAVRLTPEVSTWLQGHPELFWLAVGVEFSILLLLCCNPRIMRRAARSRVWHGKGILDLAALIMRASPSNYLLLAAFTLANVFTLTLVCTIYSLENLIYAIGATLVIFLVLTLYALQTSVDFTVCGGALLVGLLLLFGLGIATFFIRDGILRLVFHAVGAFIFSIYIIYDTQLIMGGHRYEISPEDYVLATLTLYLDVVNLFLSLLGIIDSS